MSRGMSQIQDMCSMTFIRKPRNMRYCTTVRGLAIAYGLISTPARAPLRIIKK